jgi:hypothetical protein
MAPRVAVHASQPDNPDYGKWGRVFGSTRSLSSRWGLPKSLHCLSRQKSKVANFQETNRTSLTTLTNAFGEMPLESLVLLVRVCRYRARGLCDSRGHLARQAWQDASVTLQNWVKLPTKWVTLRFGLRELRWAGAKGLPT